MTYNTVPVSYKGQNRGHFNLLSLAFDIRYEVKNTADYKNYNFGEGLKYNNNKFTACHNPPNFL